VNLGPLIAALITVESNGRDNAIGDGGLAIGALQIHKAVVVDVNRIAGTSYTHQQMTNRVAARRVCEIYLSRYATGKTPKKQREFGMVDQPDTRRRQPSVIGTKSKNTCETTQTTNIKGLRRVRRHASEIEGIRSKERI